MISTTDVVLGVLWKARALSAFCLLNVVEAYSKWYSWHWQNNTRVKLKNRMPACTNEKFGSNCSSHWSALTLWVGCKDTMGKCDLRNGARLDLFLIVFREGSISRHQWSLDVLYFTNCVKFTTARCKLKCAWFRSIDIAYVTRYWHVSSRSGV